MYTLGPNLFVRVVSAYIYKDYEVKGKMDPYVKVIVGGQSFETPVATDQGQNPKWSDKAQFGFLRSKEDKIICELWEDDEQTSDDYLGTAEILIDDLLKRKVTGEQKYIMFNNKEKTAEINLVITIDATKQIDPKKNAQDIAQAEQQAKIISQNTAADRKNQIAQNKQASGGAAAASQNPPVVSFNPNVLVQVVAASIYKNYEAVGKMDPYVKVKLGEQGYETPVAQDQGQNPKWGKNAQFGFLRAKEDKIVCEVWEDNDKKPDEYLGTAEILIDDLIKKKVTGEQKYLVFKNKEKTADITLAITIDTTKQVDPKANAKEIADAVQQTKVISQNTAIDRKNQLASAKSGVSPNVYVQVLAASIYKNYENSGKMDPYFTMKMGQQSFSTTTADNQGQYPKWTEGAKHGFYRTDEKKVILELWEDDTYTSDDHLGSASIDIEDLLQKKPNENKYVIYNASGESIGEVQLAIQFDLTQKIDKEKHKQVILDAQKQADAVSNANRERFKTGKPANGDQSSPTKQAAGSASSRLNIAPVSALNLQAADVSKSVSNQELLKKTQEIQARLGSIQVKLKPQPIVPYIENNVHFALLQGMKKLASERPMNPIRELGLFLINYSPDDHRNNLSNSALGGMQGLGQSAVLSAAQNLDRRQQNSPSDSVGSRQDLNGQNNRSGNYQTPANNNFPAGGQQQQQQQQYQQQQYQQQGNAAGYNNQQNMQQNSMAGNGGADSKRGSTQQQYPTGQSQRQGYGK